VAIADAAGYARITDVSGALVVPGFALARAAVFSDIISRVPTKGHLPNRQRRNKVNLADYDALSFDCYGTLIDWETGIASVLAAWAREAGLDLADEELLLAYGDNEVRVERENPTALYSAILAESFRRTGARLGTEVSDEWADRLGASVPAWPAFPDSHAALVSLGEEYKLIIVSNVHREGFAASNARLDVRFDKIITAEDVGAYKPAPNHFEALDAALVELNVPRGRLLHVAQSLFHDHVPAKRHGIASVWINRRHGRPGWGATPEPAEEFSYALEFPSMEALAAAAREERALAEDRPHGHGARPGPHVP
jgi:2-haloacid dehalogenase